MRVGGGEGHAQASWRRGLGCGWLAKAGIRFHSVFLALYGPLPPPRTLPSILQSTQPHGNFHGMCILIFLGRDERARKGELASKSYIIYIRELRTALSSSPKLVVIRSFCSV